MTRDQHYQPFIDWLKCLGMLLIIYGHMVGGAPLSAFPPIYLKQFGVAFFLFATGYSLSQDSRDRRRVVYNRLFELYLFGIGVALTISLVRAATVGGIEPSNYLPFFFGINIVFDNFPANPSTWYLGTYIHVILLWALVFSRLRVSLRMLVLCAAVEIVVRALLMQNAGAFIAYQVFPNWMTVFLLGYWCGKRAEESSSPQAPAWRAGSALLVCGAIWLVAMDRIAFEGTFPFMRLPGGGVFVPLLEVSAMVSVLYVGVTWLTFCTVRPLAAPAPVRFVARNSLFIFLAHMPLLFVLQPVVSEWGGSPTFHHAIYVVAAVPGLGAVSEVLRAMIRPHALRERLWAAAWPTPSVTQPGLLHRPAEHGNAEKRPAVKASNR